MPGRNVYAQMHNEKEQEMTSPVNHSEDTQNIIQGEEFIDDDLDTQTLGNARVTLSGRGGNLNSYKVPLLSMPANVQSQVITQAWF
ncbi:hypothetical protein FKM82_025844 [Ascaphus truei]